MKQYPCIESTAEIEHGRYRVRLWRDEESLKDAEDAVSLDVELELAKAQSLSDAADRISRLPRVNAVQVMDRHTKRGVVAYVNWP